MRRMLVGLLVATLLGSCDAETGGAPTVPGVPEELSGIAGIINAPTWQSEATNYWTMPSGIVALAFYADGFGKSRVRGSPEFFAWTEEDPYTISFFLDPTPYTPPSGDQYYIEVLSGGIADGEFEGRAGFSYPPPEALVLFTLVSGSL